MDTSTTEVQVDLSALGRMHKLMLFLVSSVAVVDCQWNSLSRHTRIRQLQP